MTIGAQNILALFMQERHERIVLLVETTPEGKLGLHDDSEFIGSDKSCLWRTPGVETDMIDAIGIASAKVFTPRFHIHSHMSSQWPDTGIVLATQEYGMAIGIEVLSLDTEILEIRMDVLCCRSCREGCR